MIEAWIAALVPFAPVFGLLVPAAVVWMALRYRLKSQLARQAPQEELDHLRREIALLREETQLRFADLTLMIDDAVKSSLAPPSAAPMPEPEEPQALRPRV